MKELEHYIAELPEPRRPRGEALHRLVTQLYPSVTVSMKYKMPTYHLGVHYLAWANQKHYLSLYTCSSQRIAGFVSRHPHARAGVGCLRFKDKDEFPMPDIKKVIKNALAPTAALLRREAEAISMARASGRRARK